jgi:hypothetical protein
MLVRLARVLHWCGLAIASLCGIAAFTILVAIITNKLSAWDAWAAVFFAVVGGTAWLAGRAAKSFLLEFDSAPI